MSPLGTECLDIFSPPPGAREVMTQVERLSSRDTKIALRSVRIAACSCGRGKRACMVAPAWVVQRFSTRTLPESRVLPIAPMGSLLASADGQTALPRAHKRAAGRQRRPGCGRAACRKGSDCRAGRRTVARRARPLLSLGLSGQRCESTDAGRQDTTLVQDA